MDFLGWEDFKNTNGKRINTLRSRSRKTKLLLSTVPFILAAMSYGTASAQSLPAINSGIDYPTGLCGVNYGAWVRDYNHTGSFEDGGNSVTEAFTRSGWTFNTDGTVERADTPEIDPNTPTLQSPFNVPNPQATGTLPPNTALLPITFENNTSYIDTALSIYRITARGGDPYTANVSDPAFLEHHIIAAYDGAGTLLPSTIVRTSGTLAPTFNNILLIDDSPSVSSHSLTVTDVPSEGVFYVYAWRVDMDQGGGSMLTECGADLVTSKSIPSGQTVYNIGDTVTYEIKVENIGRLLSQDVTLTDLLPAGLDASTIIATPSQGEYDVSTGVWTIGDVAKNNTLTLTLTAEIEAAAASSSIENITTAAESPYQPDLNDGGVTDTVSATIEIRPLVEDDEFLGDQAGTSVSIDILGNDPNGTLALDLATVSLVSPAGATNAVTDADGNIIGFTVPGEGAWTYNPATGALGFVPQAGFLGNPSDVAYSVENTNGSRSEPANVSIAYANPSLSMTKTADSQGPHSPGDIVTYTYTVTNDGDVNVDDVTVTDVHNGFGPLGAVSLGALTNTSGTSTDDGSDVVFDVLAPGDIIDFTAEYVVTATDLLLGNTVTNTATATGTPVSGTLTPVTANESISLAGTPRPALKPDACGAFSREGFIINPGSPSSESSADFGSGAPGPGPYDPYVLEPQISRNSSTGVVNFYQTSADASATGSFLSNGIALRNSDNVASTILTDLNHISEIWRVAARVDGVPGTTEILTIQNGVAHEHTAYWQTDVNGTIINSNSSSNAGEDDGWIYGTSTAVGSDGISFTIDVTYPADGIVILQFAQLDSTGGFGGVDFDEYECPEPSLSMTKVADSKGPHLAGDVVTYTYTVTNDGNTNIEDVVITDTHNGSDPAPTPKSETLLTDAAPAGDSTDAIANDGSWDVLAPGDTLTFEGKYTVTQTDVDNL